MGLESGLIIPFGLLLGLLVAAWVHFGWGDGIEPSRWKARFERKPQDGANSEPAESNPCIVDM